MLERVRQTRWKTSDNRFFDNRDEALRHEKIVVLAAALRDIPYVSNEAPSQDWLEEVAAGLLSNKRGIILALVPK